MCIRDSTQTLANSEISEDEILEITHSSFEIPLLDHTDPKGKTLAKISSELETGLDFTKKEDQDDEAS